MSQELEMREEIPELRGVAQAEGGGRAGGRGAVIFGGGCIGPVTKKTDTEANPDSGSVANSVGSEGCRFDHDWDESHSRRRVGAWGRTNEPLPDRASVCGHTGDDIYRPVLEKAPRTHRTPSPVPSPTCSVESFHMVEAEELVVEPTDIRVGDSGLNNDEMRQDGTDGVIENERFTREDLVLSPEKTEQHMERLPSTDSLNDLASVGKGSGQGVEQLMYLCASVLRRGGYQSRDSAR
ncbi:hypothetical protein QJS10_CPB21g01068 [Acorus calamus]|uniref:Uncharacterized protein n=1 Tax=Acorus calamus TaxID=4465 RepID=A0AAV9C3V0_ACOCL|nr:hypothetical protein QJS10_CPB21g01068 [Acorus calamus]